MNIKDTSIDEEQMKAIYFKIEQNVKKIRQSKKISQWQLALSIGHKTISTIFVCEIKTNGKHFNYRRSF